MGNSAEFLLFIALFAGFAAHSFWLPPLLLAVPYLAVIFYAAYRLGPTLLRVISVLIKGTVVS